MMLERLREETSELHKEIEKENLAGLIMSHTISREQYQLLLLQNYTAYCVTETEISKYLTDFKAEKHKQLQIDLTNEGVDYSLAEDFRTYFSINSRAEAIGAAYVVEGSALGGMMISKQIENCSSLSEIKTHHFFNGKRQNINGWKKFCKTIKEKEFSPFEEEEAVQKAKDTFVFFGRVFSEVQIVT